MPFDKAKRLRLKFAHSPLLLLALLCVIIPSAIACGSSPTAAPTIVPAPTPETLRLALASSDLAVGTNRVVFGVIDDGVGPVSDADVVISTFYLPATGGQVGPMETVNAVFQAWPVSPRGVFTAQLQFDRPVSGASAQWLLMGKASSVRRRRVCEWANRAPRPRLVRLPRAA